ncbi:MAG: cellulose biosynthesis cyclic di-GMP-binding regulatory protein BcsB [Acidobacteriota bacterium]|nr:cellulose biosynthesis cyclic di-GMP-binding regulatory protein BcsB [Acidobacteriota bacterium]
MWTLFNLAVLGVATAVAWESQQRRRSPRVALAVPSDVILADGSMIQGMTSDLSSGGVRTRMNQAVKAEIGDAIKFVFPVLDGSATLPARVVGMDGSELRAQFDSLSLLEDEALTLILYSRADAWLGQGKATEADHPVRSMSRILRLSLRSFAQTLTGARGRKAAAKGPLATSVIPIILLALGVGVVARTACGAQPGPTLGKASLVQLPRTGQPIAGQFDKTFTLADQGVRGAIKLRGVDASKSLSFSVPGNEVVKTAAIRLRYHFSPGLIAGISQLKLSLNGMLVSTIAVQPSPSPSDDTGLIQSMVDLPADMLVHDNQLTFQLIAHYTQQCEDPSNSTLWAEVDGTTSVQLAGELLPLSNDLKMLPVPFFDKGTNLHPMISVVFLSSPSAKALQAAGVIASWLGVLNESHPVRFSVSLGVIPEGNAIVIAEDPSRIPASLGLSAISGPTVAMATNPSDAYSKLLIVTGVSSEETLTAATALPLQTDTWQGPQVTIRNLALPSARHPDDAPRWLNAQSDNGQIVEADNLQGNGSEPARVYLRLPPDLDFAERNNLAFHLNYRYNGVPLGNGSTLQVYVNGAFVSSTPLPHTDSASTVLETVVPIPVVDLRPFSNTMTFKFVFLPANKGACPDAVTNLQGVILKDSHLDISDIPHSTTLPNLELFANAGYPFTRKADLSETAVILPDQPSARVVEMFLALMGHFGAQTGYPALHVTVTNPAGMVSDGKLDYLVLGTADDQPAVAALAGSLPVQVGDNRLIAHDTQVFFDRTTWWRRWTGHQQSGQMETEGGLPDALIEGIEWPTRSNRSVVLVIVRDAAAVPVFVSALLDHSQSSSVSQSVSVLRGEQFASFRIGRDAYRVGQISAFTRLTNMFQDAPWLIAAGTVLLCFLMAGLIQAILRRHARRRLGGEE